MSIGIDDFSGLFTLGDHKKYYEQHSGFVNGILIRYQENADNVSKLLINLFKNILSLRGYNKITREQLRTMAVKCSLVDVFAPKDIKMRGELVVYNEEFSGDLSQFNDIELIEMLSSLPKEERVFYNAVIIDQISIKEISTRTGYSREYIKNVVVNAKKLLLEKIGKGKDEISGQV